MTFFLLAAPAASYTCLVAAFSWLGKNQGRWAHAAFVAAIAVALATPAIVIAVVGSIP